MDTENSNNIFRLFKELSKEILIVLVTHDTAMAERYADRIISLQDGKIINDKLINVNIMKSTEIAEKEIAVESSIVSQPQKTGLSSKSSWVLAVAFNKAKKGRRLAFMIISIIIIMLTTLSVNWSLISYNQMTSSTYSKRHNSELLQVQYQIRLKDQIEGIDNNIISNQFLDLKPFSKRIDEEKNIKSAKVYPAANVTKISQGNYSRGRVDKFLKPISMYDYYSSTDVKQIAVTDNMSEVGIKLIEGRSPINLGEVAIPKGMKSYVDACGGVYDANAKKWISLDGNEIFKYDFGGVKIVGIFDDNLKLDDNYENYSAVMSDQGTFFKPKSKEFFEELEAKASDYVNNNYLSTTVVVSTATDAFYRDTAYMNGYNNIERLEGEYINLSLTAGNFSSTNLPFLPANANTKRFTDIELLEEGVVMVDRDYAERHNIKEGDKVKFETKLIRGSVVSFNGLAYEKSIEEKDFTVRLYNSKSDLSTFVFSEKDFNLLTDNFARETNLLLINSKDFSLSDFNYLSKTAIEVLGADYKTASGEQAFLEFNGDYLDYVLADFNSLDIIRDYVMIALCIIFALCLVIFGYNITSIIVTGKANELLILKSLGANKKDYYKIYGIFTSIQLAIELIIGIALGALLLFGVNLLMAKFIISSFTVALPIIGWEILITALIVIASSMLALAVNIGKINDKNLRKAFQKTKD